MEKLIPTLKVVLGTVFALYMRAHACHWNVEGPFFESYHRLFADIYQDAWDSIDAIAEQIRQLDAYAPASLERMIELSRIKGSNDVLPASDMLQVSLKDHEILIAALTEALHLAETADKQGLVNFLAERIEAHSKMRWQLRASAKRL